MCMSKKNYEEIAKILNKNFRVSKELDTFGHDSYSTELENDLINYFKRDNPNFNSERFIDAITKGV